MVNVFQCLFCLNSNKTIQFDQETLHSAYTHNFVFKKGIYIMKWSLHRGRATPRFIFRSFKARFSRFEDFNIEIPLCQGRNNINSQII